jgi:hypothetical protein
MGYPIDPIEPFPALKLPGPRLALFENGYSNIVIADAKRAPNRSHGGFNH